MGGLPPRSSRVAARVSSQQNLFTRVRGRIIPRTSPREGSEKLSRPTFEAGMPIVYFVA